jgi:hypothetical protein
MEQTELRAGPDHLIVVYRPADTGGEIDPVEVYQAMAADATRRAGVGARIVSMSTMPLRHSGAWVSRQGSGFQTRLAVAVLYEIR